MRRLPSKLWCVSVLSRLAKWARKSVQVGVGQELRPVESYLASQLYLGFGVSSPCQLGMFGVPKPSLVVRLSYVLMYVFSVQSFALIPVPSLLPPLLIPHRL